MRNVMSLKKSFKFLECAFNVAALRKPPGDSVYVLLLSPSHSQCESAIFRPREVI